MFGLAVQIQVFPDEGLQGYLARMAEANAVSIEEMLGHYRRSLHPETELAGKVPVFWRDIHCHIQSPSPIPMSLWNSRNRRYCGLCLGSAPYWRGYWELSLATECHEHRAGLIQDCPACKAPLTWSGASILSCGSCGAGLLDAHVPTPDAAALWLSGRLSSRLSKGNAFEKNGLTALSLNELHDLAVRFGARISEAPQRKPLKIKNSSSLVAARRVSSAAACLLKDWPLGFNFHLRKLISKSDAECWKLSERLGLIYRDIYTHLNGECFSFIREEFESTLACEWHGPVGRRNRRLSNQLVDNPIWVPVRTAAVRMKVDMALIRRMVKSGEIQAVRQKNPSGKTNTLVNLGDLHNRRSDLSSTMSLEQASLCLSLPEVRVRQMLQSDILEYYGGCPSAGERWWVSGKTISSIGSMGASLPPSENIPPEAETLVAFLRYRIKQPEMAVEIIRQILRGDIRPINRQASPEAIGKWLFRINDLTRICEKLDSVGLLTVKECASALRIKEQVAYDLVRLAIVESVQTQDKGVQASRVSLRAVAKFEEEFVFGRDIAMHIGRSPRWLVQHLTRAGRMPIAGPGIPEANCRQYVWRRSNDLDHLVAAIDHKAKDISNGVQDHE